MHSEGIDNRILGPPHRAAVRMSLEDIRYITGDAYRWGRCETGGAIYGLWTHRGEPVVLLATEAGPGATREAAHFAQDAVYLTAVNRELWRRYGIQYIGNWHCHHFMRMPGPSGGDVEQVRRLAGRNGLHRMVQIVLTCEQEPPAPRLNHRWTKSRSRVLDIVMSVTPVTTNACEETGLERDLPRITVNAFVYDQAQTGSYAPAQVRPTEQGTPFRAALKGSNISAFQDAAEDSLYPMHNISFDGEDVGVGTNERISDALSALAEQVSRLPKEVADRVQVVPRENLVILYLPLADGRRAIVSYDTQAPSLMPQSVYLTLPATSEPVDVTAAVLRRKCAFMLDVVYETVGRIQVNPCDSRTNRRTTEVCVGGPQQYAFARPNTPVSEPKTEPDGPERGRTDVD